MRAPSTATVQRCGGFTLLEMMIVLFIMMLLVGIASMSFQGIQDGEVIGKPAAELKKMAKEAVRRAGIYEQTQTIVFEKNGFSIRYRSDASAVPNGDSSAVWQRRVEVPGTMNMKIRHWGAKDWQPAAGQRWIVQPSGLCEPLAVRMEIGRSYAEMQFNPLTGGIADEMINIAPP